jgi:pimeloyl-ACP methyl ester carboxylesterase
VVDDRFVPQEKVNADHGLILANAERLLRLLMTLPGRRDDALAVVNGFFGDRLADQGSTMAIPMTLRSRTDALTLDRDSLARAFPQATGRIALLVHGLMANESIWDFPGDPDTTYGSLLARDHRLTPIYLRYNTGRHISVNGREFAGLLHRLVAAWPVPVRDISLIGHSMGGLVIRASCHYASVTRPWRSVISPRRSWISKTRRVVLIGVPNTGAPLEKLVNLTSVVLSSLPIPVTRLVGLGLDTRSAGIRDLRFGAITDEDWLEQDPGALQRPLAHSVGTGARGTYLIIAGGITADTSHPLARVFGDTLVTTSSASGTLSETTGEGLFPGATVRQFSNMNHLALAHKPEVYDEIDRWWP